MRSEELPRASYRPDLAAIGLLAFAALSSSGILFRVPSPRENIASYLALAAVFAGCLAAAVGLRAGEDEDRWAARYGPLLAASFAVMIALALLLLRPGLLSPFAPLSSLVVCVGIWAIGGAAMGCVLQSNALRSGHVAAAFVVGMAVAVVEVAAWSDTPRAELVVLLAGGSAALGALLLAASRRAWAAAGGAVAALAVAASGVGLQRLGWPLPWLASSQASWAISAGEAAELSTALTWSCGLLALAAPMAFLPREGRDQRRGLARLHMIVLLWVAGVALVSVRPLRLLIAAGEPSGSILPLVLAALGAASAGIAADSWGLARVSLTRAFVGGAVGLAALLAVGGAAAIPGWTRTGPHFLGGAALSVVALLVSLVVLAAARIGALVGAVPVIWLWSCAGLSALALTGYLSALSPSAGAATALTGAGVVLAVSSCAVASELRPWRDSARAALKWVRREWRGKSFPETSAPVLKRARDYPLWLRMLRFLTYTGYAPWWVAAVSLRAAWAVIFGLATIAIEVAGGMLRSTLELALGKERSDYALRVVLPQSAPVVMLSPGEEEEPEDAEETRPKAAVLGEVAILPLLALTNGAERAARAALVLVRGLARRMHLIRPPARQPSLAEQSPETETIVLDTPPDLVPGRAVTLDAVREAALRRRSVEPKWRRMLRGAIDGLLPSEICARLAPDTAQSWDDRVFRAEVVGPRGRRFELLGHLWESRRRLGCVVTVPILAGHADKAVEVGKRSREVRHLLEDDSEQLKKVLLRATYRTAVMDITAGMQGNRTVVCESPREDLLEPHQDRQCELREELPGGGHRCRMPMQQDRTRGGTTLAACSECDLPEVWQRCSNLKLKGTIGIVDDEGVLHRRAHMVCALTGERPKVRECPRQECFSPSLITRIIAVEARRTR